MSLSKQLRGLLVFLGLGSLVMPPPQESMDNSLSLFDYRLNNPYNDLIDDFDPYLEYGKGYQNRTVFEDAFYG